MLLYLLCSSWCIFSIVKLCPQAKYPPLNEQMKTMCCVYMMKDSSAIKNITSLKKRDRSECAFLMKSERQVMYSLPV